MRYRRTSWLLAQSLCDGTLLLEVDVPALGLTSLVLQGESEDGVGALQGALAGGIIGLEGVVNGIESLGGWEGSCGINQRLSLSYRRPELIVGANMQNNSFTGGTTFTYRS